MKKIKSDGTKHKYEVKPMQNVYEEVSEQEYTDRVVKRQQDNWIIDDCKIIILFICVTFIDIYINILYYIFC